MSDRTLKAPIFNIQTYCIHDGPGIRTTVFMKGCPLRCLWCANPESNEFYPQLMTYSSKCTACGRCVEACPNKAISIYVPAPGEQGKPHAVTDRSKCVNCGKCVALCPAEAREIAGTEKTVEECVKEILKDKLFMDGSGGGMTVSGGEALAHSDFTANLLEACREEGVRTAIETSSFASREVIDKVFAHVNLGLLDIKHMDSETHKKLTGVPNGQILDNIRHVHNEMGVPVIIRVPCIPGYNADDDNIRATAEFVANELEGDVPMHLLPYHRLGDSKLESLGRKITYAFTVPTDDYMNHLKEIVESCGVKAKIGG